ncbi:hypothetical protein MNZ22_15875 [Aeromonas encheleia]|uniref:hypothetical protein n=1 Tax=Aeromonas TaxID=642 RepID=UPI001C47B05B|nr:MULTISPECIES: hypothetical protein [Aeromonas]MBV7599392.1 hypothetical protein [Aeromonas sp. sia0103]UNP88117.1 hypothetical protein MNZ22_15875 [Aeromonas encheleia]
MSEIALQIDTPVKTIERYSADTGIPIGTVRKMIAQGQLQTMPKAGPKHRVLINMVALYQQAASAAYLPAISR